MESGVITRQDVKNGGVPNPSNMTEINLASPEPSKLSHTLRHNVNPVRTGIANGKGKGKGAEPQDPPSPNHEIFDQTERESKLELYEYDSLVDIVGLKSMGGQQALVTSSPADGEDVAMTLAHPRARGTKMGTLMGVFIPCLQNILGIIFYIRFSWIVGIAGIAQSLLLVSLCCLCTFLTGLSLSAIATNGAMKGGGPYYLISRALGPEVGVSIGLCFFLGNAIAGSMYILGAVETFLDAIPRAGIFRESATRIYASSPSGEGSHTEVLNSPNLHDLQVYGVIIALVLCLIVFGGVKIINKVAPAFLVPVLLSVFLIFIGILAASHRSHTSNITGLRLSTLKSNWGSDYQRTNRAGLPAPDGIIYWNFQALLGLFFPAVTGIMAGSNRSAFLKDTQRSIPIGTLAAIGSTTILYLISVFMFGAVATRKELLTNRCTGVCTDSLNGLYGPLYCCLYMSCPCCGLPPHQFVGILLLLVVSFVIMPAFHLQACCTIGYHVIIKLPHSTINLLTNY